MSATFDTIVRSVFERSAEVRLDLDAERAALAAAKLGDEDAKLTLILAYAPVLRNGVTFYTRSLPTGSLSPTDLEDARSQAVLGLLEAIEAFDPEAHERLAAVAPGYVRNAVSVSAATVTGFTVPERTLKRFFGILRAADGNTDRAKEIAPDYEMRSETFLAVLDAVRNVTSYEGLTDEGTRGDGDYFGWQHEESVSPIIDSSYADADDRILVDAAFSAVDTFEGDVVRLGYGFSDFDPQPDAEIAHRLGFSRPKIQRTRTGALDKMRSALGIA